MSTFTFSILDDARGGFLWTISVRRWLMVAGFTCSAILLAGTGEDVTRSFDILAGPATFTLRQFSAQAGVQLVFPTDLVTGVRTNSIDGRFTPLNALAEMLKGTKLAAFREPKTGALGIRRAEE